QGLQTVIEVERERHTSKTGEPSREKQYYISSLPPDVGRIAEAIRSHWEVENKAHWVLDVTFSEDDSRISEPETERKMWL
ncbi:ISAs1 family transposase, partial [Salmonella enterica]